MDPTFAILAFVVLASSVAAMWLRNLVHCALCLAVTFVGLAAVYLQLQAEFVGFAQILVYVGAVAILILFAILLTRSSEPGDPAGGTGRWSPGWWAGAAVAVATLLCLWAAIGATGLLPAEPPPPPGITVKLIGLQLLHRPEARPENYILPLLVTGVLLTVAMIGAVIIALREPKEPEA